MLHRVGLSLVLSVTLLACAKDAPSTDVQKDPAGETAKAPKAAPPPPKGVLQLGAPIASGAQNVTLADVAKNPGAYKGKTITTSGTVTSVCQHMGCWMEIKDDASQAHIKMAGHDFFVPKTASGHKARVQATLVSGPQGEDEAECNQEAAQQMGHAVAKLQLEATGVELD